MSMKKIKLSDLDLEEFLSGDLVVNCDTEDKAIAFYSFLNKHNVYSNLSNDKVKILLAKYRENLCFRYNTKEHKLNYSPMKFYVNSNYEKFCYLIDDNEVEEKTDLRDLLVKGNVIELRNGKKFLLRTHPKYGLMASGDMDFLHNMSIYDKNLSGGEYGREYDIIAIYSSDAVTLNMIFDDDFLTPLWKRKIVYMTLDKIREKLGYDVMIKEDE